MYLIYLLTYVYTYIFMCTNTYKSMHACMDLYACVYGLNICEPVKFIWKLVTNVKVFGGRVLRNN